MNLAHSVQKQKGIVPAWSNSRNDVVARREEERDKANDNDRQRKRIRFESKPTSMYNGAGKISNQVRPYYYGRHLAAVEVGATRDSAGERLEWRGEDRVQANSHSAHARPESGRENSGHANSNSAT